MSLVKQFDKLDISSGKEKEHINTRILDKYSHRIKTDELSFKKAKSNKDKANRATVENVLDPRTMRFLRALMNRGIISDFNGCLSTGKEANVYHAFAGDGIPRGSTIQEEEIINKMTQEATLPNGSNDNEETIDKKEYAVKIFKTSILVFKDRERYVDGEFRFRNSRSQHNPRKMIKIWAEKEFRNLKRIYVSGVIPVPRPIEIKNNVLVMEFLNRGDGFASPRLRDYPYQDKEEVVHYYHTMVAYMRLLYQVCGLVHADLSEYNTLVHNDKLYVIDVSQSVQPEHPMSLDFLRMDIKNVNLYFEKMGISIFPEKIIFQFVIAEQLDNFNGDYKDYNDLRDYVRDNLPIKQTEEDEAEDEVFRSLYLVRNLSGLEERDFDRFTEGKFDLLKSLLAQDNKKNFNASENNENEDISDTDDSGSDSGDDHEEDGCDDDQENDSDNDEDDDEEEDSDYEDDREKILKGKKYEDKDLKKQRKQEAKDAKREKRKTKVKKHVKKKLVKKTKSKK
ncbi:serine/threonine-protein kinase Rio1p [Monosporozyma unispora]|nr:protein kinase rio1 [Kazachstania unispora]